jgi:hypothetical protein
MAQKHFCFAPTIFFVSESFFGEMQKTSEVVKKRFWEAPIVV